MSRTRVVLGDALDELIDHRGKTPKKLGGDWAAGGHRVVSALNIKDNRVDDNDHHYITESMYQKWMRVPLEAGDVLLTSEAPTGEVAYMPVRQEWALGQRLFGLRGKAGLLDGRYLFYALRGGDARHQMMSRVTGTTVSGIRQSELVKVELDLPPIEEQRAIAATLGALDDKIESNRRIVAQVPELIRGRVADAVGGGSVRVPVSSLASFVNGGAYTNGASGNGRIVIRIAELNGGPGPSTIYNDIVVPDEKTARPGDILMSWSGSLGVYRWARDEAIINQHIFKVMPHGYPTWLVFDRVDAVIGVFQGIARDKATTMGHIQRGHLDTTLVDLPMRDVINELDMELKPLWQRLLLAESEALTLAALRDTLLPELLSGRVQTAPSQAG